MHTIYVCTFFMLLYFVLYKETTVILKKLKYCLLQIEINTRLANQCQGKNGRIAYGANLLIIEGSKNATNFTVVPVMKEIKKMDPFPHFHFRIFKHNLTKKRNYVY